MNWRFSTNHLVSTQAGTASVAQGWLTVSAGTGGRIASWAAFLATLMLLFIALPSAHGQQITGSVVVTVTDNTGALLTGADLHLTMASTGLSLEGKTHPDGTFTYPSLQPGSYELRVTAPGFKVVDITGITVSIGEHLNIPVKMELGTVKQSVTVSAATESMLNAGSPSVGQVIHTQTIRQLPLNGRNFMQLLLLGTGVAPVGQGDSPATTWTGRNTATVIMGGLRESDVSYLVNGIDTRNARFGSAGIYVSPDAIQEFRNQRTTFGAEFGHSAAVVNMTLRSGSNDFHGDIFELNRNRDYAANDYFLNNKGLSRPPFNQNNFGATLAGPVWIPRIYNGRNRTFFMFNYEGFRQIQGQVLTGIYPSAAQLGGNLADDSAGTGIFPLGSAFCAANPGSLKCANIINPSTGLPFPGNVIPSANLNPINQLAIPFIPAPNVAVAPGGADFPAFNTIGSPSITDTTDQYNARIDQTITTKNLLFATFSNYNSVILNPTLQPLGGSSLPIADHLWTVTYNHVFTPNLLNDFRLGLNNSVTYRNPVSAFGPNYAQTLFELTNTNQNPLTFGVPDFGISGVSGIGSFSEVIGAAQKNYQLTDNLSWSDGPHNIMAGVELIHERFNQTTDFGANPSFTFDGRFTGTQSNGFGLGDFLLGIPFQATSAAGDSGQNLHTNYYGVYARDNWRVTPTFTFSYGLRYEYSLSPIESQNRQGYFDLTQGKEIYAGEGVRRSIVKPDYTNLAPRIGFTWAPRFVHNAVLRGGFGLYYATDNWNELQFSIVGTKFYGVQTLNSDPTKPTLSTSNLFPPLSTSLNTNPFTLDPNSRTPYYQQWSLDIQKTFARNYLAEIEYAGNIGKHLPQRMNANVATIDPTGLIPIRDRVPFPDFGFILYSYNGGSSNWNALTAKIQRRFDNGLSFLASFTYSNAIDQGITDDFSAISRDFKKYDRGHSDYTVPTRFVLSGTYDLPFGHGREFGRTVPNALNYAIGGWQINTITTLTAGQYGTATLPTDWLNIGAFSQSRPNVNWSLVKKGRHLPTQYLNPAAFSFPSTHIEGNVGRNTIALPGYGNIDFSLFKSFPAWRESFVQLRFEFFNLLNHTQFNGPHGSLGPGFGVITSDRGPRVIQLGARVQW